MDYFLARYYSATQGRFTSPDEFSGGPTELFAEVAAHNPTFYSDLASPQTLCKYQYALNNPLRFIDPDGHQETVADAIVSGATYAVQHPLGATTAVSSFVWEAWKGEGKALANIGIGANNLGAIALRKPEAVIETFEPDDNSPGQQYGFRVMNALALAAPAISKAAPAGVFFAEVKQSTAVTAEAANAVKTYQTYTKTNAATNEVYVGRTSGAGTPLQNIAKRDSSHAYTKLGFGPAKLDKSSSSYPAIRGREQQLIEYFRVLNKSANKINAVAPNNPNAAHYCQSCRGAFGRFGK